jgi:hypothetical protein
MAELKGSRETRERGGLDGAESLTLDAAGGKPFGAGGDRGCSEAGRTVVSLISLMKAASSAAPSRFRNRFRRIGRALVLATQLVVLVAPLAEAHDERPLSAHVEAPRTVPHPGHHADECPACMLLSVHGRPAERPRLDVREREQSVVPRQSVVLVVSAARDLSNSSRAPPAV